METKRLSMNTSLKNARIFDDDSWESERAGFLIKKEPNLKDEISARKEENYSFKNIVEQEPEENEEIVKSAKLEQIVHITENIKKDDGSLTKKSHKELGIIKQESEPDESSTNGELNATPIKNYIINEDTNPSPFNKELFQNFCLHSPQLKGSLADVPIKSEIELDVKRFVFNSDISSSSASSERLPIKSEFDLDLEKSNFKSETPSSPESSECEEFQKCPVFERLGPKVDYDRPTKSSVKRRLGSDLDHNSLPIKKPRAEIETDPEVISRRQKQIDYGKNTLGYDNYLRSVPRAERAQDDPKTPNKFLKYSRRGFDGLVKQWRLKLHKYDPEDS